MIILVQQSPTTLARDHGHHPNLGVLSGPRRTYTNVEGWPWAADNDAYLAWDRDRYVTMLDKIRGIPGCVFVTAPDVVGDAQATLERFNMWQSTLHNVGQPIAYVAQDGIEFTGVPWDDIGALFIGGTTDFKMGEQAARYAREGKRRGLWLHMGRVNTGIRIRYAKSLGCDSVDGTNFSMFRKTNLPWALHLASSEQLWQPV